MPTETLPTRAEAPAKENLSRGFWLAIALHSAAFGGLIAAAWIGHTSHSWGDSDPTAGSIQASVVSSLPLQTKQRFDPKSVLASDNSSAAATPTPLAPTAKAPTPPKAEPPPKRDEVLIPNKTTPKPPAAKETPVPSPTSHTPAPTPPTPKATSGDSSGVQIPQAITQLKNGTAALTVEDRNFGDRYAYYIRLISDKITRSKAEGDPDGPETRGKKTVIRFTITREGIPIDATILTPSGSAALDTSTLRAIQRIDTFGPLPEGNQKVVRFEYDSK
jgi:protein TonB